MRYTNLRVIIIIIISEGMAKMVACALVSTRFDFANSVLYGTIQKNISKQQKAENLLARVVTNSFQSSSHTLLQQFHWLRIEYHINFKIANITSHHFISFSLLTYFLPCMLIIPLAPSGCLTSICSPFHLSALHLAFAASVPQTQKSGTVYPNLSEHTPAQPHFIWKHLFQLAFQSP